MSESQSKSIKAIFDEIRSESGSNRKIEILKENSNNPILKQVLYNADSNLVKHHRKQSTARL